MLRKIAAAWGAIGVLVALISAILRLSIHVEVAVESGLSWLQWGLILGNIVFMAYSEGYKGFHLSFAPRFAARVKYLLHSGTTWQLLLAPLFCFGYFGTGRAKQVVAVMLTLLLAGVIYLMAYMPQPWRGIVDAGVVVGLSIGVSSMVYWIIKELQAEAYLSDPQVA